MWFKRHARVYYHSILFKKKTGAITSLQRKIKAPHGKPHSEEEKKKLSQNQKNPSAEDKN